MWGGARGRRRVEALAILARIGGVHHFLEVWGERPKLRLRKTWSSYAPSVPLPTRSPTNAIEAKAFASASSNSLAFMASR